MRNENDDFKINNNEPNTPNIKNMRKKKHIIKMVIWLLVMIFVLYQVFLIIGYTLGKVDKNRMWIYNGLNSFMGLFIKPESSRTSEDFSMKVAGLGDIYATSNTISGAKSGTKYDFSTGTDDIRDKLKGFDAVMASINTVIADKSVGYSSKDIYSTPTEILDTIKELGINYLATASNHSMDKNENGIANTIKNLDTSGIKHTGVSSDSRAKPLIIEKNNISIGLISYATTSNVKLKNDKTDLINLLTEENLKEDITFLKEKNVDFIISYLNIPNEDILLVGGNQKKNVETLFNAGVDIVLGTGSLVVQESVEDNIRIEDVNKHVYGVYSLGDFMGKYESDDNKLSVISNFTFNKKVIKNKKGDIVKEEKNFVVNSPIPIWTNVTTAYKKKMYVLEDEIKSYNEDKSSITAKEYEKLKSASTRIKTLFNVK